MVTDTKAALRRRAKYLIRKGVAFQIAPESCHVCHCVSLENCGLKFGVREWRGGHIDLCENCARKFNLVW